MNEDLRRLAEAATPGPWRADKGRMYGHVRSFSAVHVIATTTKPDAAYIAALNPQTVLALLDRLAALEEALAEILRQFGPEQLDKLSRSECGTKAAVAFEGTPK